MSALKGDARSFAVGAGLMLAVLAVVVDAFGHHVSAIVFASASILSCALTMPTISEIRARRYES